MTRSRNQAFSLYFQTDTRNIQIQRARSSTYVDLTPFRKVATRSVLFK